MNTEDQLKAHIDSFKIIVANLHQRINTLQEEVNDLKHNQVREWNEEDVKANSGQY